MPISHSGLLFWGHPVCIVFKHHAVIGTRRTALSIQFQS